MVNSDVTPQEREMIQKIASFQTVLECKCCHCFVIDRYIQAGREAIRSIEKTIIPELISDNAAVRWAEEAAREFEP